MLTSYAAILLSVNIEKITCIERQKDREREAQY